MLMPDLDVDDPPPPSTRVRVARLVEAWNPGPPPYLLRRFVPQAAPPPDPLFRPRSWLTTVVAAWQAPPPPSPLLRYVPQVAPLFSSRAWMATVNAWYLPDPPPPQPRRYTPQELLAALVEPLFKSRAWLSIVDAWHRLPELPQTPRRTMPADLLAPLFEPLFRTRAWLGIVLDWWRTIDISRRRRPQQTQPGVPVEPEPPPPEPEEICFTPVAAPVTAFSRSGAPSTGYSRGSAITGSYTRQTLVALGATRLGAPGAVFARMDEPECVPTPPAPPMVPVPDEMYVGAIWLERPGFPVSVYPRMRAFDGDGVPVFSEVVAATTAAEQSLGYPGAGSGMWPTRAIANSDRSVIGAWDGSDNNMHVQKLDELGNPLFGVNGLTINSASSPVFFDACTDGDGGCWIAWNTLSNAANLMVAHVLANGTVEAGFPLELPVTNTQCINVQVCPDESGGAIVAWAERVTGWYDIYVQHVTAAGAQWTAGGVRLTTITTNDEIMPTIASDGLGGVFLAWVRETSLDEASYNIYAQHVSPAGVAQWTAGGVPVCVGQASVQIHPQVVRAGTDDCIVCWKDARSGNRIYAQRVAVGVVQWAANGINVLPSDSYITGDRPCMVSDGANGAIIVAAALATDDIRAQRIDHDGMSLWDAAGVVIAPAAANARFRSRIAADELGGVVVIWHESKIDTGGDIYAQHVNADGELQLDPGGLVIASGSTEQSWADIAVTMVPPMVP